MCGGQARPAASGMERDVEWGVGAPLHSPLPEWESCLGGNFLCQCRAGARACGGLPLTRKPGGWASHSEWPLMQASLTEEALLRHHCSRRPQPQPQPQRLESWDSGEGKGLPRPPGGSSGPGWAPVPSSLPLTPHPALWSKRGFPRGSHKQLPLRSHGTLAKPSAP